MSQIQLTQFDISTEVKGELPLKHGGRVSLICAVAAAVIAIVTMLSLGGTEEVRFVVAGAFGVTVASAVWIIADSAADWSRCWMVSRELGNSVPAHWAVVARELCSMNSSRLLPEEGITQTCRLWKRKVSIHSWQRHGVATCAAAFGCIAAYFRLTPERVLNGELLTTAFPALVGWLIWAGSLGDVLLRTTRWYDACDRWAIWARATLPIGDSLPSVTPSDEKAAIPAVQTVRPAAVVAQLTSEPIRNTKEQANIHAEISESSNIIKTATAPGAQLLSINDYTPSEPEDGNDVR